MGLTREDKPCMAEQGNILWGLQQVDKYAYRAWIKTSGEGLQSKGLKQRGMNLK